MEGYRNLQALPNSPLTPLTPLSENTQFNFNLGGDGSLDHHIENVRLGFRREKQHRLEQCKSEKIIKMKDGCDFLNKRCPLKAQQPTYPQPKARIEIKVTEDKMNHQSYANTPKHIRSPLRPINRNLLGVGCQKQQQQKQCQQQTRKVQYLRPASPVAVQPLSPRIAHVLKQKNLMHYHDLFQREELDMFTFGLLQPNDLRYMGILNDNHIRIIMEAKEFAQKYFN
uniref:SAM domain-containing protein n=1 Tax=Glossina brevipalpis TaxID=37001 RepID=A0A1A9WCT1_9MUSC